MGGASTVTCAAWTVALGALGLAACGARTGLLVPDGGVDAGVDVVEAAPACAGKEAPLLTKTPVLYLVLDASGSMAEDSKWQGVQASVANVITELGSRARFGAAIFPEPEADECTPGAEVMPVRLGDATGATAAAFLAATNITPNGGTPTAATLAALAPELSSFPQETFAILATDGGPNCDPALSCNASSCTSNMDGVQGCPVGGPPNCCDPTTGLGGIGCLDGDAAAKAVAALHASGVSTFVMGIPGSAPYAAVLDQIAQAGGTARATEPLYYAVDTADTGALTSTLGVIVAKAIASCTFTLAAPPPDPNAVNVYVGGALVPQSGADGWTLAGTKLTLLGSTCDAIQTGTALSVRVIEGCPTVTH
jgi:hypothetical protein